MEWASIGVHGDVVAVEDIYYVVLSVVVNLDLKAHRAVVVLEA